MSTKESRNTFASFNEQLIEDLRAHRGAATSGPFVGRPVLILTTVGARSEQPRENPLVYTRDGERYVVIASKGGAPTHPSWYHNLVANPHVTLEVLGESRGSELAAESRIYIRVVDDRVLKHQPPRPACDHAALRVDALDGDPMIRSAQ